MKTAISIIICLFVLILSSCNSNNKESSENKNEASPAKELNTIPESTASNRQLFAVESAYFKFTSNAAGQQLTREWCFDQYGNRQYEENYMMIIGQKTGDKKIVVDGFQYLWNYDETEGTKSKFYQTVTDYEKVSEKDIKRYGIDKIGYEDIIGRKCLKVTMEKPVKSTIWVWNGIVLKSESDIAGNKVLMEAVEINEGIVDKAFFILPENITFRETN
ncbi:MAG: hypothetical protein JXA77_03680 [Bacteroidales bacterium]|nr:hypothetical protein [Bacteroidales bacterium]MBN2818472.1 hypothetical protein [Bacteroidales bacterium]